MNREFAWGVATSAYQIEGARHEGGKGDSIWDRFSDMGRLRDSGDVACDHYHRLEEDLDLLGELGVDSYRFSVSWPRVIPDGDGEVSQQGVDFYRRLVSGLVQRDIEPCLTLYHWDLPQALHDKGGWESRATIESFARYAAILAESLGDDIGAWITQNEPWVSAFLGYRDGVFAPGLTGWSRALTVGHHLLLSHGQATRALKGVLPGARVGIALDCRPSRPRDAGSEEANRHFDGFRNRWFFDPVFGKGYPEDMVASYEALDRLDPDMIREGDLDEIAVPIDFLGLNYYTTLPVDAWVAESEVSEGPVGPEPPEGFTEMGWRVDPAGLTGFLERVATDYSPESILITENGASFSDAPGPDGRIADQRRIDYLDSHIEAARAAAAPVDGYYVWSFLDNIEWLEGFSQRFGLVWVDTVTRDRIPKDSFYWYRDTVARLSSRPAPHAPAD